jgi:hypothetical protein
MKKPQLISEPLEDVQFAHSIVKESARKVFIVPFSMFLNAMHSRKDDARKEMSVITYIAIQMPQILMQKRTRRL